MVKLDLIGWTERTLWCFLYREKISHFVVRCMRGAGLVVAEELPGGLIVLFQLAGHDGVVSDCGAFP